MLGKTCNLILDPQELKFHNDKEKNKMLISVAWRTKNTRSNNNRGYIYWRAYLLFGLIPIFITIEKRGYAQ